MDLISISKFPEIFLNKFRGSLITKCRKEFLEEQGNKIMKIKVNRELKGCSLNLKINMKKEKFFY
jgi:hypothetical protein